jgi:hypothetical protein
MTRWRAILAIAAALLLNGALLWTGRGGLGHIVLALGIALWLGLPFVVIGAAVYALSRRRPRTRRVGRGLAVFGTVCISGIVSLAPGHWLVEHDIAAAERDGDAVAAQLDDYKRSHGSYPRDLSAIRREPNPPFLARDLGYYSDGSRFGFTIGDPRGLMDFIGYSSEDHLWKTWH